MTNAELANELELHFDDPMFDHLDRCRFYLGDCVAEHRAQILEALRSAEKLERAEALLRSVTLTIRGILKDPYGCSLCDSGLPRNPAKGHQPDCPYQAAMQFVMQHREYFKPSKGVES
jgi:hypothetical protein